MKTCRPIQPGDKGWRFLVVVGVSPAAAEQTEVQQQEQMEPVAVCSAPSRLAVPAALLWSRQPAVPVPGLPDRRTIPSPFASSPPSACLCELSLLHSLQHRQVFRIEPYEIVTGIEPRAKPGRGSGGVSKSNRGGSAATGSSGSHHCVDNVAFVFVEYLTTCRLALESSNEHISTRRQSVLHLDGIVHRKNGFLVPGSAWADCGIPPPVRRRMRQNFGINQRMRTHRMVLS
jgi:hypothetical protein